MTTAVQRSCHVDGVPVTSVVYVGDSIPYDVIGARAAGMRAVWLNRAGVARPPGVEPDAEIRGLAELPDVVAADARENLNISGTHWRRGHPSGVMLPPPARNSPRGTSPTGNFSYEEVESYEGNDW